MEIDQQGIFGHIKLLTVKTDAGSANGREKRFTQYRVREHVKFEGIKRQNRTYRSLLTDNVINCSLYFAAHFRND